MIFLNSCVPYLYPYELSVCAIFQNDAEYLEEWITFHQKQGVEHFWLYNNLSDDNYQEVLQPFIESNSVTLIDWPQDYREIHEWNHIQCSAYKDCISRCQRKTKWVMMIDTDEFVFSPESKSLPAVLKDYIHYPGVGVNWVVYGTSEVIKAPAGQMLKHLVMRAPLDYAPNHHIKTIVQPTYVKDCVNPHFFIYKDNRMAISEKYIPLQGPVTREVSVEKLRINHYAFRDMDYLINRKIPRYQRWNIDSSELMNIQCIVNSEYDPILAN